MAFEKKSAFIGDRSKSDSFMYYPDGEAIIIRESLPYMLLPVGVSLLFFCLVTVLIVTGRINEAPPYFKFALYLFWPLLLFIAIQRASYRKGVCITAEKIVFIKNLYVNAIDGVVDIRGTATYRIDTVQRRRSSGSSFVEDTVLRVCDDSGEYAIVESCNREKTEKLYGQILDRYAPEKTPAIHRYTVMET
ncbi:hypothetical protein DSLASN_46630 [Desulfoluna limicola]|uniref:DUF304 domain-containing protein n=1 Tax=Desulfoluna limicola TaxID=2810562 RepID=A0ABM7PP73_9BACT|nr:hypothetical protein [Desulfoluna limicola]BCS99031.1 hypothetical protein DSLASN_46630 [Desulfoluna limicola]